MKTIMYITIMILASNSYAASFNCNEANSRLERAICSDPELSKLDEKMSDYYFESVKNIDKQAYLVVLREQRDWLKKRKTACKDYNTSCLIDLYKKRILAIRSKSENLTPYTGLSQSDVKRLGQVCAFRKQLPRDLKVFAGGAYSGKRTNYQLGKSNHSANRFEVIVNEPDKPVALLLGAYEPSVWNIAWTQGTQIKAVFLTGYYKQAVAGLPKNVPVVTSTHEERGPCGYFYIAPKNIKKINPMALKVFGKKASMIEMAQRGELLFGDYISPSERLFTSRDNPPEKFYDRTKQKTGKAGLNELMQKGHIRRLTASDVARWKSRKNGSSGEGISITQTPTAGGYVIKIGPDGANVGPNPSGVHNGYMILKKITIPGDLYGGNLATFMLKEGVPYPDGKLGHSSLYDFNTMRCHGICRMIR